MSPEPSRARSGLRPIGWGLLVLGVSASACLAADTTEPPSITPTPVDGGAGVDPGSRSPALKRKDGEQLSLDLASALEIERAEVCRELGQYDCAREAHRIVLGGVEPYRLRIEAPLPGTGVGAPIAVERLALAACGARARADFASASPVVFAALRDGEPDGRGRTVDALYDRLLGRRPDPEERRALAEWSPPDLDDRDYATLACFVVATTLEHLFY